MGVKTGKVSEMTLDPAHLLYTKTSLYQQGTFEHDRFAEELTNLLSGYLPAQLESIYGDGSPEAQEAKELGSALGIKIAQVSERRAAENYALDLIKNGRTKDLPKIMGELASGEISPETESAMNIYRDQNSYARAQNFRIAVSNVLRDLNAEEKTSPVKWAFAGILEQVSGRYQSIYGAIPGEKLTLRASDTIKPKNADTLFAVPADSFQNLKNEGDVDALVPALLKKERLLTLLTGQGSLEQEGHSVEAEWADVQTSLKTWRAAKKGYTIPPTTEISEKLGLFQASIIARTSAINAEAAQSAMRTMSQIWEREQLYINPPAQSTNAKAVFAYLGAVIDRNHKGNKDLSALKASLGTVRKHREDGLEASAKTAWTGIKIAGAFIGSVVDQVDGGSTKNIKTADPQDERTAEKLADLKAMRDGIYTLYAAAEGSIDPYNLPSYKRILEAYDSKVRGQIQALGDKPELPVAQRIRTDGRPFNDAAAGIKPTPPAGANPHAPDTPAPT